MNKVIWSLVKILSFIALVAGLAFGVGKWAEFGNGFRLQAAGWELNPGPLQSVVLILLLFLLMWLIMRLAGFLVACFRFLSGDETAISRYFDRNRERKGYAALSDGMLALASGDGRQALAKAARAERFLKRPELTDLLSAQAAEMSGDRQKAADIYKRLLRNDRTRFVGVRGLLKQRIDDVDNDVALPLAQKAFELNPRHEETQEALLSLQAEAEDWLGARATLQAQQRYTGLPKDVYKRRDAVLAVSEAMRLEKLGGENEAVKTLALEANRISPDLIPAAIMAAKAHIADEKTRQAVKVIRKAWATNPHPDLAATFAGIEENETPSERIKRFQTLLKEHSNNAEITMLAAELHIADEDFPAARKIMGKLVETDPTARALTIMAAIERGEGAEDTLVRAYLAKAINAPRGPAWICDKCDTIHEEWAPTCIRCTALDTLSWKTAPQNDRTIENTSDMLPLFVGEPEAAVTNDETEDAEMADQDIPPPDVVLEDPEEDHESGPVDADGRRLEF